MYIILYIMIGLFSSLMIFASVLLGFRIGSGSWPWGKDNQNGRKSKRTSRSQYLVAVWRDEPFRHTIDVRDSLADAARLAEFFRRQWSHVYLTEVIAGEGPEGHAIVQNLSSPRNL